MSVGQVYLSFVEDLYRGAVDCDTDLFYAMLVDSSYTPNQLSHLRRSDITGEVVGAGYVSGGQYCPAVVLKDPTSKSVSLQFALLSWPASSLSARYAVYYKHRGGLPAADELVCVSDFGAVLSTNSSTFYLSHTTITTTLP